MGKCSVTAWDLYTLTKKLSNHGTDQKSDFPTGTYFFYSTLGAFTLRNRWDMIR